MRLCSTWLKGAVNRTIWDLLQWRAALCSLLLPAHGVRTTGWFVTEKKAVAGCFNLTFHQILFDPLVNLTQQQRTEGSAVRWRRGESMSLVDAQSSTPPPSSSSPEAAAGTAAGTDQQLAEGEVMMRVLV